VIYSLELGDRELPLALANFRERLIPQLRRIGVALDWSTAKLPEVSGVTPGNALTILRILQEAITNALKHGPARTITIRGAAIDGGKAAITVENDGRPFAVGGKGHGLENIRRRIAARAARRRHAADAAAAGGAARRAGRECEKRCGVKIWPRITNMPRAPRLLRSLPASVP
jgi:two-component system, NarL family, sensor histidine kinase UhpB